MRFVPQPCAEFPNDNPDLHDGAMWVCNWTRARARAVVSAAGVARQTSASETDAVAATSEPVVATSEPVVATSASVVATDVAETSLPLEVITTDVAETSLAVVSHFEAASAEPDVSAEDLPRQTHDGAVSLVAAAVGPTPEDAPPEPAAAEAPPAPSTPPFEAEALFDSERVPAAPASANAELTWADIAHLVVPPPEPDDELCNAETGVLPIVTRTEVVVPTASSTEGLSAEDQWALNVAFDRFLGADAPTPSENLSVILARTVAPMITRASTPLFGAHRFIDVEPPRQLDLLERSPQLSLDLRIRPPAPKGSTRASTETAAADENPRLAEPPKGDAMAEPAADRGPSPTPPSVTEASPALELPVALDTSRPRDPVPAHEPEAHTPETKAADIEPSTVPKVVVAELPRPSLGFDANDDTDERIVEAVAAVDDLFDDGIDWQTPTPSAVIVQPSTSDAPPSAVRQTDSVPQSDLAVAPTDSVPQSDLAVAPTDSVPQSDLAVTAPRTGVALQQTHDHDAHPDPSVQGAPKDAAVATTDPAGRRPSFRVPRPEAFAHDGLADEKHSPVLDTEPAALEPLALDLTPPPPGVAGWEQLCDFVAGFLLTRGATRSAALVATLLDGKKVDLERLPASTLAALRETFIAETRGDSVVPTVAFRKEASTFQREYRAGRANPALLLRWLASLTRALLGNSVSLAAVRAHLEQAGIDRLLRRAA